MKKYILSLFGLALFLLFAFPAQSLAVPTYKYELVPRSNTNSDCENGSKPDQILVVNQTNDEGGSTYYCYEPEWTTADYVFVKSVGGGQGQIEVNDSPGEGTYKSLGESSAISIADVGVFNDYFASGEDGTFENSQLPPESGDAGDQAETRETCEDKAGGIGWFLCPGVNALGSTLEFLDNIIASLLNTDESQFNTEGALYEGWKIMRNIAFFVLIPIGLVMILGTSLGFEVFSAYTIKKAFPRLLFAILFITFSWQLTGFAVEVTNSIGRGMDGIVTSPIRNSGEFAPGSPCTKEITLPCFFDAGTSGVTAVLDSIVSSAGSLVGFIGFLVFLYFYAGTLAIAFAIGMAVLLARQIAITAAILLAPLAILSWIFPGNDGLWKSWWNLFSKLLLMYPLIILLVSSGKLFAWIVGL